MRGGNYNEYKIDVNKILKTSKNYFEDFICRSTYHSNAIEGSTLSFVETYPLLFDSKHSKIENADVKEIYEAINHNIIYVGGYRLSSIRMIGSNKKFPLPYELEEIMTVFLKI